VASEPTPTDATVTRAAASPSTSIPPVATSTAKGQGAETGAAVAQTPEATGEPEPVESKPVEPLDPILPRDQWPSFACDIELTEIEQFICTDWHAADTDRAFGKFWSTYLDERSEHLLLDELQQLQASWLELRHTCWEADVKETWRDVCLRRLYRERGNVLTYAKLSPLIASAGNRQIVGWGAFTGTVGIGADAPSGGAQSAIAALVELAEAKLQLDFQQLGQFELSHGPIDITISSIHGQRISAFDWAEAGFIQPAAHPYFSFREFLYDREQQGFIEVSELFRSDTVDEVAAILYSALLEASGQTQNEYLADLNVDELGFFPVFDDQGRIAAFENSSQAESIGGYAGRICFYGLTVSAARVIEHANDEYAELFAPNLVDGPVEVPNCE